MPAAVLAAQSVTELLSLRARTQPDDPAVHTGAPEFGDELKTLTYSDIERAVDRLAAYYATQDIQTKTASPQDVPPEKVIAVLVASSIEEILLEIALAKLGLTALLLSTNNSTAAVAHLCKITNGTVLIYGSKYEQIAKEAQEILKQENIELGLVAEKRYPLWGPDGAREGTISAFPPRIAPADESKRACAILHSSGSTGFPKPVAVSHYSLLANALQLLPKPTFMALPLFHAFGHIAVFQCLYHGVALTLMPPHLPLTPANLCRVTRKSPTPPLQQYAVPYILKLQSETEEGVETLKAFHAVSFAGAALPDNVGDKLAEAGVNLMSIYGGTEIGAFLTSRRDFATDKGWNWLRASGMVERFIELIPQGSDTFELVVKDGWPGKVMGNREDGAFASKDLVLRHPVHKNWFKYLGRLDDTINMLLGEKTNPVPIELAVRGHSTLIKECIVFGDGRPQVGALIQPSEEGAELSKDKKAYIDAIWPAVVIANAEAPTHSRILPDMIEILPYDIEIPVASKLSILRPACYTKFAPIIDSVYERFERGSGEPKQLITTKSDMESFLTETILDVLGPKATKATTLSPDVDLFSFGIDSLQATRVKNTIVKSLELGKVKIGQNVVYEHPTISQLADYLLEAENATSESSADETAHKTMLDMVEKYVGQLVREDFAAQEAELAINGTASHVIVLTGATGSLGAHILDQFIRRPDVSKVICLSRAKSHEDSIRRVKDSLQTRLRSLTPETEAKIVSYAADVNSPQLGLTPEEYESIRREATAVIHNAWPVNFVLSVESFDEHIAGAVNLLNLTLEAPREVKPAFLFSSSVSAQMAAGPSVEEEFSQGPEAAVMGYGRSKWVVEKIMERAGKETGARCSVLRIGQVAGDTEHGVWNETESWPLMFKSITEIHALPNLTEQPSWLPVDQAARTIIDVVLSTTANSPSSSATVRHILNPYLTPWADVLAGVREGGLEFETVSQAEWLDRLVKSNPDVAVNPAYKLLDFYQARFGSEEEAAAIDFKVEKVKEDSETMRTEVKKVGKELVALWTRRWKQSGFLA